MPRTRNKNQPTNGAGYLEAKAELITVKGKTLSTYVGASITSMMNAGMDVVVTSESQPQMTDSQFDVNGDTEFTGLDLGGNFFDSTDYGGSEVQVDTETSYYGDSKNQPDNTLAIALGIVIPIVVVILIWFGLSLYSAKRGLCCYRLVRDKHTDADDESKTSSKWHCVRYEYSPTEMMDGKDNRKDDHFCNIPSRCFKRVMMAIAQHEQSDESGMFVMCKNIFSRKPLFNDNPISASCHVFDMKREIPFDKDDVLKKLRDYKDGLDSTQDQLVEQWKNNAEMSLKVMFGEFNDSLKNVKWTAPTDHGVYWELNRAMKDIESSIIKKRSVERFGKVDFGEITDVSERMRQRSRANPSDSDSGTVQPRNDPNANKLNISCEHGNTGADNRLDLTKAGFTGLDVLQILNRKDITVPSVESNQDHQWKSWHLLDSFIKGNLTTLRKRALDLKLNFDQVYLRSTFIGYPDAKVREKKSLVNEKIDDHLHRLAWLIFRIPDESDSNNVYENGKNMQVGYTPLGLHKLEDLNQFFIDNRDAWRRKDPTKKILETDLNTILGNICNHQKHSKDRIDKIEKTEIHALKYIYKMFEHFPRHAAPPNGPL